MLSALSRIGSPQAIGIQFEGDTAHASRVASTPFGTVEVAQISEPLDPQRPQDTVVRLVKKLQKRAPGKLPVAIGLPAEDLFFTTRSMQAGSGDVSPRVLLREALRSSNVPIDEMLVDVVRSQPGRRQMASIVAARRELIENLTEPLIELGMPRLRVEPVPCAFLRRGRNHDSSMRRGKIICRVFLNDTHMLAVLTAKGQPFLWRQTKLPRGDETSTMLAVVRSLSTIGEQSGLEARPEVVVIHGRSDLRRLLDMDWVHEQIEGELDWLDGPELDGAQAALGLAEGCFDDQKGFDLAKHCQVQPTLWQVFPWSETVVHAVLMICLALFLGHRLLTVKDELTATTMRNAQDDIASLTKQELMKEKKDLKLRVSSVQKFLDSRIVWTNYHREIASVLPEDIYLTSLWGTSEFSSKSKSKVKTRHELVLKGAVAIPQDGLIPHEVDRLMNALREHPLLTKDFPQIELADLKQFKRDNETLALFTVLGMPKDSNK